MVAGTRVPNPSLWDEWRELHSSSALWGKGNPCPTGMMENVTSIFTASLWRLRSCLFPLSASHSNLRPFTPRITIIVTQSAHTAPALGLCLSSLILFPPSCTWVPGRGYSVWPVSLSPRLSHLFFPQSGFPRWWQNWLLETEFSMSAETLLATSQYSRLSASESFDFSFKKLCFYLSMIMSPGKKN